MVVAVGVGVVRGKAVTLAAGMMDMPGTLLASEGDVAMVVAKVLLVLEMPVVSSAVTSVKTLQCHLRVTPFRTETHISKRELWNVINRHYTGEETRRPVKLHLVGKNGERTELNCTSQQ